MSIVYIRVILFSATYLNIDLVLVTQVLINALSNLSQCKLIIAKLRLKFRDKPIYALLPFRVTHSFQLLHAFSAFLKSHSRTEKSFNILLSLSEEGLSVGVGLQCLECDWLRAVTTTLMVSGGCSDGRG